MYVKGGSNVYVLFIGCLGILFRKVDLCKWNGMVFCLKLKRL